MNPKSLPARIVDLNEDQESEVILVTPYLQEEFKHWLMETRGIKEKSADDYLRAYESAYESLYEELEVDLYCLLRSFIKEIPQKTGSDLTKEYAPELVNIYLETIQEKLNENEDAFTKANLRALMAYHDFIADITDSSETKVCTEKSTPFPDEEEFLAWLEKEYKMDYDKAKRIISSIRRMDMILPSLDTDPMSFLDVLRAIPDKNKRNKYLDMVSEKKGEIHSKSRGSYKTILNGLANVKYYANFLNRKSASKKINTRG
ncbi:MAG: hypothetical protein K2G01_07220 [Paramuribaculum sp.]|nr:hypothetical protein [Paramuribaculum sp.]